MLATLWEAILHTLSHTWPLIPFLYLTYLLMELLERQAGEKTEAAIRRAGKAGPLLGGLLGALPQCGMSAAGAGLYAARLITPGTLIALFLSTSDEMIPVMLSSRVALPKILTVVAVKVVLAILLGFGVDLILHLLKRKPAEGSIGQMCREGRCHCDGRSVWYAALVHTATVTLTVFLVSLVLHLIIHGIGDEQLGALLGRWPLLSCVLSALVGLIPNCASSVAITQLYISGGLSAGALLSGLLTGAGAGVLVLIRVNRPVKNTLWMLAMLLVLGVCCGVLFDLAGLGPLLGL